MYIVVKVSRKSLCYVHASGVRFSERHCVRSHKTLDEILKVEKYKLARGIARRVCSPKRTDLSSRFL